MRHRLRVLEGLGWLVLARLLLLLPFRWASRFIGTPVRGSAEAGTLAAPDRDRVIGVARALARATRRFPHDPKCLARSMAGRFMLGWRGLPSLVMLGVRHGPTGEVLAHAWLTCGDVTVTGAAQGPAYDTIVSFVRSAGREFPLLALARKTWPVVRPPYRRLRWHIRKTRWGFEWLRNVVIDWRYGGYCGGYIPTRFAASGAYGTTSADYYQLDKLFGQDGVRVKPDDVLVDVGCGKGRIINYWLHRGYENRMYGLELDPEIAARAAARLRRFANVSIIAGDAIKNLPDDTTLIFLFNPFGAEALEALKRRVEQQFSHRLDTIRLLYYHCKMAHVFREDPRWHAERLRLKTFYPAELFTRNPPPGS